MAGPRPPRGVRRGASTYRLGDEVVLLGDETEAAHDAVVRFEPDETFPPLAGSCSTSPRAASVERDGDATTYVGHETADEIVPAVVIVLLPPQETEG